MHIKRITGLSLLCIMLFTYFAFAAESVEKSEIFYSKDKNYDYPAEKMIREKGKDYRLKDIRYEVITADLTKAEEIKNLKEERAPKTKVFTIDGKKVKLYLDEKKTKYTKNSSEQTYVYEARDPYNFTPDQSRKFTTKDGKEVIGELKDTAKGGMYKSGVTIPGKFTGDAGAKYFYFANSGNLWPLNTAAPTWQGYENDILTYLGLNPNSYSITGGRWTSENTSNGKLIKSANFSGTKNVCDYTCTYTASGMDDTYTANAVYSAYMVKAVMTYEPYMSLTTKVLIGAGIAVFALALAVILYYVKRRKKNKEEQYI